MRSGGFRLQVGRWLPIESRKKRTWDRRHQPCLLHLVVRLDDRDTCPGRTKNRLRYDEITRHHQETRADYLVVSQCPLGR